MNKKLKKLFNNPKAYFYDYFRKQVRAHPNGPVSLVVKMAFANAKTDLGYGKEVRKYLKESKLEQAEKICIEGMGVVPKAIRPHVLYAEISMRRQDFNEAKERWKSVVDKFPNKAEGYAGEARAYAALGDFENDEKLCRSGIERMPQEIWPYVELAEISMRQEDFNEALKRWSTVREKFPDKAPGYVRASVSYCNLEKFSDAEELCRQCMKIAPNDIRSFAEYAEISMRQKNFDEALKRWQTLRDRFPKRAVGYVRAAAAYSEIEEYLKAEDLCRISMEVAPKDIRSFAEYAEISMHKGDFKEASNRWEIVRDKFPHEINGYIGGGRAYMELLEYAKAEDLCTQGLNAMEGKPASCRNLYYLLIDITLRQHGRSKDCIKYVSSIEQSYRGSITDRRYYIALTNILTFLLGRDGEKVSSPNTDFLVIRLFNEPLNYTKMALGLNILFYRNGYLNKYNDARKQLMEYIQAIIQKEHLDNPLAVLVSSSSLDEERVNAHLRIIRENCYHSAQLCAFQSNNTKMLEKACDAISLSAEWKSMNPCFLFDFARAASFANQEKGDQLISEVYKEYGSRNLTVSDPVGLLCFRHKRRQELLSSASELPSIGSGKLKIAVCVSGQLRGYKGNLESLVEALGLGDHDYKVFVHTWRNIGRKFPVPAHAARVFSQKFAKTYYECFLNRSHLQEYIQHQFPKLNSLLLGSSMASPDDLKKEYNNSNIVIEDEEDERFSSWDNQKKMHYKIYAAHKLAKNSGEGFDLMIRIRPDLKLRSEKIPSLVEIYSNSRKNISVFTVGGFNSGNWNIDFSINDMFAIGIPQAMDVYANTYIDFHWHKENNTYLRTCQFQGHNTLEHNLYCHGIHVDKVQQATGSISMGLLNPEKLTAKEVYEALCKDVKNRKITTEDQRLLEACGMEIGL